MRKERLKLVSFILIFIFITVSVFTISNNSVNAGIADGKTKFLGNVMNSYAPENFDSYWNQVTPENGTKWGSVESTRNTMNWSNAEEIYNYAKSKNMPFKFHTLVWGSQEPSWISGLSKADQKAEVIEWMKSASAKFGDAEMIDVVNEPLHAKPSFKDAIGGDGQTGWDWVIWSFQEARKHFKGKLILNEYGVENDQNACEKYIEIIKLLKDRNLIDGIGIQTHLFNLEGYPVSTIKSNVDRLAATGLPIYSSEFDLGGDDQTQLNSYKEKFPIFWEHPSVKGITLWGYVQGETWRENTGLVSTGKANPSERPAMKWLKDYIAGNIAPSVPPSSPPPNGEYSINYTYSQEWSVGATVNVIIKNEKNVSLNGWELTWEFPGNQQITNSWNSKITQTGNSVVAKGESWNNSIPVNSSINFGFNLQYSGSNPKPINFKLKYF